MPKQPRHKSPWDIKINPNDTGDDHYEIAIEPRWSVLELPDDETLQNVFNAYRWIASVGARVAVMFGRDLHELARHHRCANYDEWTTHCGIFGATDPIVTLDHAVNEFIGTWITVPADHLDEWVKQLTKETQRIAAEFSTPISPKDADGWHYKPPVDGTPTTSATEATDAKIHHINDARRLG